jgi:hypothetical protein
VTTNVLSFLSMHVFGQYAVVCNRDLSTCPVLLMFVQNFVNFFTGIGIWIGQPLRCVVQLYTRYDSFLFDLRTRFM